MKRECEKEAFFGEELAMLEAKLESEIDFSEIPATTLQYWHKAELGKFYRSKKHKPNKLTAEALEKSERGEEVYHAKDAGDLFKQLDIDI